MREYGENSPLLSRSWIQETPPPFCAPKKYWDLYDRKKISSANPGHPAKLLSYKRELEGIGVILRRPSDGKLSEKRSGSSGMGTMPA